LGWAASRRENGQGDGVQPRGQQGAGGGVGVGQGVVDGGLDQAALRLDRGRLGQQAGLAQGGVDLAQGDGLQRARQPPAAAVALLGHDQPLFAQARHGAADHDRIGRQTGRQHVRGLWSAAALFMLGHVQQGVQDVGEAGVSFHVTSIVT
jgi:hypothetical protein